MGKDFEVACQCFNTNNYIDQFNSCLNSNEQKKVEKAIDKRKAEFTYGRFCAKKAYLSLTGSTKDLSEIYINNDSHGAPFFDDGSYHVSISHENNIAVAVVSKKSRISFGVDLINISEQNSEIIYKFLSESEKLLINDLRKMFDYDFLCAAAFSGKEALSKLFGYGFSVFPTLEISDINKEQVSFKNFKNFKVYLKLENDYLFSFSIFEKDKEIFNSKENQFNLKY